MKGSAGKILMLVENAYPQDSRVRHEADTLVAGGYEVAVIAKRWEKQPLHDRINGVTVFRLPQITLFKKSNINSSRWRIWYYYLTSAAGYFIEYTYFTTASFFLCVYVHFQHGFQVLHLHNPPNTLFLIGLFFRIFGKKFVFDHHDLSAELFLSRYEKKGGWIYRYLLLEEKLCLRLANVIIATNESYKAIDMERGRRRVKDIFVVRNGPLLKEMPLVPPDEQLRRLQKTILVYIGIMGPQDGVDYLLRAVAHLVFELGRSDVYALVMGTGDSLPDLINLRDDLQLQNFVHFTGFIPKSDLLRYLSSADICLDPNPSSPLNDYSTWIKIMEYMAYAKPIVSFDLRETRFSAGEAARYVPPNDITAYAEAIRDLMDNAALRKKMGASGYERVWSKLSWERVSGNLIQAYQSVLGSQAN